MKDEAKKTLTPRLRFPEFQDDRAWIEDELRDVATFFKGKGLPKSAITTDGKHPCIHYGELFVEYFEVITTIKSRTNLDEDVFLSVANDVLMPTSDVTPRGLAKASCVNVDGIILGGDILVIRSKTDEISGEFLARYIRREELSVLRLVSGTTVFHLYPSSIGGLKLAFPSKAEQQKIAECLSTLDERIGAESQKLDALKAHKKGLMQQLFPREGETLPRLRFPEFQDAPEWSRKSLGAAATFYNGRAYKQEELLEVGKYRVLRVGNFFTSNSWYHSDLELDDTKYCDTGDLLYAWSASFGPRIWRGGKAIYHYHIWKVVERNDVDKAFLYITLEGETERMKAQSANGLGLLHITKGTIESWDTAFPEKAEQQRIASCLSSLDDLIAAQGEQVEALKTHKRGLMQQLFPSPKAAED